MFRVAESSAVSEAVLEGPSGEAIPLSFDPVYQARMRDVYHYNLMQWCVKWSGDSYVCRYN